MAEYNIAEKTDVIVGGTDKNKYLYYQLVRSLKEAKRVDIIVSFLMESGVKMLIDELKNAIDRGAKVRILTGNYLGITQPSALYLIKNKLGDKIDIKFYNDKSRAFHPKSYIFHYDNYGEIYIGSSNISKSALTSGIEWNYRFDSHQDKKSYEEFSITFEDLFDNHSIRIDDDVLKEYSKNWHCPAVIKDVQKYDFSQLEAPKVKETVIDFYEPRGAQIEALCALENTRADGAKKALVHAATGIGKTYLSAFDSKNYERVLFVAHREEILKQAAQSYKNVRHTDDYGFFNGEGKCTDASVIFASVATLGRKNYLEEKYFKPDYFDYIVIDEFHHAVSNQYKNIIEYFKPKFLLGLTATPERMDGRNIYEICDYNVAYEINLKEAINKGMLVPFHYYGIYDETDYSQIRLVRGTYSEEDLNKAYVGNNYRSDLIMKYYKKYGSQRALGFCCSRAHAEDMARYFSENNVPAAAVYSDAQGQYAMERNEAIEKLTKGELKLIFSVDMFNEGVDIPSVDMVLFLRPTESPIVFLQQLGRGLRKSRGKEYLNVLDFIGNYDKAGRVRFLLAGDTLKETKGRYEYTKETFPDDCYIDFDMKLIDLFEEMDKKQKVLKDRIMDEFFRVKDLLGHRPSRMELFTYMDDEVYEKAKANSKVNPFRGYLEYLNSLSELTDDEKALYNSIGREFIKEVETTKMTKVFKMPVLMSFYNEGSMRMAVTDEQVLASWKNFFDQCDNWKDLEKVESYDDYLAISDEDHIKKIKKMPINFLVKSREGFFIRKEGYAIALKDELMDVIDSQALAMHFKDAIDYRAMEYYRSRYLRDR